MGWMWGYRWCQNTVWQKKKAVASPTILALSPVTASFCQFQTDSLLWSCEDIFSPWTSDRQIKHVPPTELQCRLTWSMQSQSWRQIILRWGSLRPKLVCNFNGEHRDWVWLIWLWAEQSVCAAIAFRELVVKKNISFFDEEKRKKEVLTWCGSEELSKGHHVFNFWL